MSTMFTKYNLAMQKSIKSSYKMQHFVHFNGNLKARYVR